MHYSRGMTTRPFSAGDRNRRVVRLATADDRDTIYASRHAVYARELGQHAVRESGRLDDALDARNEYVVVAEADRLLGFVSVTPPGGAYSLDKYVPRAEWPFPCDDGLYEVRLLTVDDEHRRGPLAYLLMHAALRTVEEHGGERITGIGRREVLDLYTSCALVPHGRTIRSGDVEFELMSAPVAALLARADELSPVLRRALRDVEWDLPFPVRRAEHCYHGGQSFFAVGPQFHDLSRRHEIVAADVLDAWFPPAPAVLDTLRGDLGWIARTSPPTLCDGMVNVIAEERGVPRGCVVPGAGSSDLIFAALPMWLRPGSRALLLDPTYGEYAFVLEQRVGCKIERLELSADDDFAVDPGQLEALLAGGRFDLAVIVNPNSPTGRHLPRARLLEVIEATPRSTRFWIDETYVEYVGTHASLEHVAAASENVVVCKSMSKVYALSGLRAAYLVAPESLAAGVRRAQPPWAVSLPGQIAAVHALKSTAYYESRWAETAELREEMATQLRALGLHVVPGVANFLLCRLPGGTRTAAQLIASCRAEGVYLRDISTMAAASDNRTFRTAVRSGPENEWVSSAIAAALTHAT